MYEVRFEKWCVPKKYSKSEEKDRLLDETIDSAPLDENNKSRIKKHVRSFRSRRKSRLSSSRCLLQPVPELKATDPCSDGLSCWQFPNANRNESDYMDLSGTNSANNEIMNFPLGINALGLVNTADVSRSVSQPMVRDGCHGYVISSPLGIPTLYRPLEPEGMQVILTSIQTICILANTWNFEQRCVGRFWDEVHQGIYLLQIGCPMRAWPVLKSAGTLALEALVSDAFLFIKELFLVLSPVNTRVCPEFRILLLCYLRIIAFQHLGAGHPIAVICHELLVLGDDGEMSERALTCMIDELKTAYGSVHPLTIGAEQYLVRFLRKKRDLHSMNKAAIMGQQLLYTAKIALGPRSSKCREVARELEHVYIDNGQLLEALEICHFIVDHSLCDTNAAEPLLHDEWAVYTMEDIAKIYKLLGRVDLSILWLQQAAVDGWTLWQDWVATRHIFDKLEAGLIRCGRDQEAELWKNARHWK